MIWSAFVIGLLGSLHCVGMCGPIAMIIPVGNHQKIHAAGLYHAGRITTYAVIGVVFGTMGQAIQVAGFQSILSISLGVLLLCMVFYPIVNYRLNGLFHWKGLRTIRSYLSKQIKSKKRLAAYGTGLLNGLLPCGLVWLAIAGAMETGYVELAAVYMIFFGLGTIPLLSLTMFAPAWIPAVKNWRLARAIPVATLVLGLLFLIRGSLDFVPASQRDTPSFKFFHTITLCHDDQFPVIASADQ